MDFNNFRCGYVATIGLANSGKSSLINAILEEKVLPVCSKAQMTRNNVKGIYNSENSQIIFIDTPGYHKSEKLLNQFFIKETYRAVKEADLILFLIKADENRNEILDNKALLQIVLKTRKKVIYCISKIDLLRNKNEFINDKKKEYGIKDDIFELSIKNKIAIKSFLKFIEQKVPNRPALYDPDYLTDANMKQITADIIREKIFRFSKNEIPYSCAVEVIKYLEKDNLHSIYANIIVERNSQKIIIIGKKGDFIKKIGIESRKNIEKLCQTKVYLELFVKVKTNWTKNKESLKEFGYL